MNGDALIAVVCDGAGSALYGRHGASITCRAISEAARIHFRNAEVLPDDFTLWNWIDEARERINRAAASRCIERRALSATLIAVIATASDTMVAHIGDGAAVLKVDSDWVVPSWPAHGEYASQTYFITDDPAPQMRIARLGAKCDAVTVFTDGLERLVLDFKGRTAPATFFEGIIKPFASIEAAGVATSLSASLKRYLDSDRVNERTDDDKSLIIALRR